MFERLVKGIIEKEGKKAVTEIAVDAISVNPYQPRRHFDRKRLEELAQSIREQGVLQPIIVRRLGGGFELVAGERRLRASKLIGKRTIPAIVRSLDDHEMIEIAFIENLQREQLNEYEEAEAYSRLLKESGTLNERSLAERLGRSEKEIHRRMWILRLPQVVKKAVVSHLITMEHAHLLAGLTDEKTQLDMLERIYREKLPPETVRRLIEQMPETVRRFDTGYEPQGDLIEAICSGNAAVRLEGCFKALREMVSAFRAAGIGVRVNARTLGGNLCVEMDFPLEDKELEETSAF